MKILFVTHYPDLYGANMSLANVAGELKKKQFADVSVLCLSSPNGDFVKYFKNHVGISVKFVRLYNTVYPLGSIKGYLKAYLASIINTLKIHRLDDYFAEERFDFIHTNTMATLVGAQLAQRHNITHVWHIREFMEEDYACSQIKNYVFQRASRYTSRFIAISNSIKQKYEDIIDSAKIDVIYNGIPQLARMGYYTEKKSTIFSFIGVIRKEKGALEAIQAFLDIDHDRFPNCELWVIGGGMENGNASYIEKIQSVLSNSRHGTKVKFFGYREDVSELLDHIDVGLVCSKLEAFGRVTIEYMMKEVYVIGANSGGTAELIQDGITGTLYDAGDVGSLRMKITEYLNGSIDAAGVIRRAKEFSSIFTIDKCVRSINEVYQNILDIET